MAELVDALVSDASGATRGSSSLLGHTNCITSQSIRLALFVVSKTAFLIALKSFVNRIIILASKYFERNIKWH